MLRLISSPPVVMCEPFNASLTSTSITRLPIVSFTSVTSVVVGRLLITYVVDALVGLIVSFPRYVAVTLISPTLIEVLLYS